MGAAARRHISNSCGYLWIDMGLFGGQPWWQCGRLAPASTAAVERSVDGAGMAWIRAHVCPHPSTRRPRLSQQCATLVHAAGAPAPAPRIASPALLPPPHALAAPPRRLSPPSTAPMTICFYIFPLHQDLANVISSVTHTHWRTAFACGQRPLRCPELAVHPHAPARTPARFASLLRPLRSSRRRSLSVATLDAPRRPGYTMRVL